MLASSRLSRSIFASCDAFCSPNCAEDRASSGDSMQISHLEASHENLRSSSQSLRICESMWSLRVFLLEFCEPQGCRVPMQSFPPHAICRVSHPPIRCTTCVCASSLSPNPSLLTSSFAQFMGTAPGVGPKNADVSLNMRSCGIRCHHPKDDLGDWYTRHRLAVCSSISCRWGERVVG